MLNGGARRDSGGCERVLMGRTLYVRGSRMGRHSGSAVTSKESPTSVM